MPSTFLSLHYHLVFSTRQRVPFIKDSWLPRLHEYLGGSISGLGGIAQMDMLRRAEIPFEERFLD